MALTQHAIGISFARRKLIFDDGYEIPITNWFGIHGEELVDPEEAVSFVAYDPKTKAWHAGHTDLARFVTIH